jgi:hypothetical protein
VCVPHPEIPTVRHLRAAPFPNHWESLAWADPPDPRAAAAAATAPAPKQNPCLLHTCTIPVVSLTFASLSPGLHRLSMYCTV